MVTLILISILPVADKDNEDAPAAAYGFVHEYGWEKETLKGVCWRADT